MPVGHDQGMDLGVPDLLSTSPWLHHWTHQALVTLVLFGCAHLACQGCQALGCVGSPVSELQSDLCRAQLGQLCCQHRHISKGWKTLSLLLDNTWEVPATATGQGLLS